MSESSSAQAVEALAVEEPPEATAEPTMMNVRSEGLKLDLVLLQNRISGLTIDYQNISNSAELQRWIKIVEHMLSGSVSSLEGSIPQILSQAATLPVSQQQPLRGPEEEPQEATVEPTMINVRSEGLKLDLVLLQNRISGLTIDYQNISNSAELQRWIKIIDGMLSGPTPSPERSVPQTLEGPPPVPVSQPQPQEKGQEGAPKKTEEQGTHSRDTEEQEKHPIETQEQEAHPTEKEAQDEPLEENGYRTIVLHAVDLSLDTLGHDGKHAILSLLENRYGFRENDIPDYPRSFVELLDELLGSSSKNLEREIISNIRNVSDVPGESLEAVVESLKEHCQTAAQDRAAAEEPKSVGTKASTAGFRYNATYSRRRD